MFALRSRLAATGSQEEVWGTRDPPIFVQVNPAEGSFLRPRTKTLHPLHLMSRRPSHIRVCVDVQIWICRL